MKLDGTIRAGVTLEYPAYLVDSAPGRWDEEQNGGEEELRRERCKREKKREEKTS